MTTGGTIRLSQDAHQLMMCLEIAECRNSDIPCAGKKNTHSQEGIRPQYPKDEGMPDGRRRDIAACATLKSPALTSRLPSDEEQPVQR
jgi:hypothetical protein